jgi:GAF domain-containing protein
MGPANEPQPQDPATDVARRLRDALTLTTMVGSIAAPLVPRRLVETVVEIAAHVLTARVASISLLDEAAGELVIEYTLGPQSEEARGRHVPLGHGIAGLVAASGQPLAVWDAQSDPRHAAEIAEQTGYRPNSILCVPLAYNDRVIGVLEVFDKAGGAKFTGSDLETLELFALQAAIAIEQSRTLQSVEKLFRELLSGTGSFDEEARKFASDIAADAAYSQALGLASLVKEIAQHGPAERALCEALLRNLADYLHRRPTPTTESWTDEDLADANLLGGLHH